MSEIKEGHFTDIGCMRGFSLMFVKSVFIKKKKALVNQNFAYTSFLLPSVKLCSVSWKFALSVYLTHIYVNNLFFFS